MAEACCNLQGVKEEIQYNKEGQNGFGERKCVPEAKRDEGISISYLILKLFFDVFHCNFLTGMYLNLYSHFFSYKTKTQERGRTSFCGCILLFIRSTDHKNDPVRCMFVESYPESRYLNGEY